MHKRTRTALDFIIGFGIPFALAFLVALSAKAAEKQPPYLDGKVANGEWTLGEVQRVKSSRYRDRSRRRLTIKAAMIDGRQVMVRGGMPLSRPKLTYLYDQANRQRNFVDPDRGFVEKVLTEKLQRGGCLPAGARLVLSWDRSGYTLTNADNWFSYINHGTVRTPGDATKHEIGKTYQHVRFKVTQGDRVITRGNANPSAWIDGTGHVQTEVGGLYLYKTPVTVGEMEIY